MGVHQGSLKSVQRKDSLLIFPHIQSIKLTQTQVCDEMSVDLCRPCIVVSNSSSLETADFLFPASPDKQTTPYIDTEAL